MGSLNVDSLFTKIPLEESFELKELLSYATKNSHLVFDEALYNWLDSCSLKYRSFYYQMYADDIFILFNSPEYLNIFRIT